ncbi:MAG: carboxy terminal-processing peptidase, partial [Flavobacteriales bacterium]|nr:carboxy terminal-processing peptidase [Flavobacteriales bacterium]
IPDMMSVLDIDEASEKYAMAWDSIPQADYSIVKNDFSSVIKHAKERVDTSSYFKSIKENIVWLKDRKESKTIPLSLDEFTAEDLKYKEDAKRFDQVKKYSSSLNFSSPEFELPAVKADTVLANKRKSWHEELKKDATLYEGVNILSEIK